MGIYLGIDLGGTSIHAGVVTSGGKILREQKTATPPRAEEVIKTMGQMVQAFHKEYPDLLAVGVGTPGSVDVETGETNGIGGNVADWHHVPIRKKLERYAKDLPIYVENDANCACLAELYYGGARGYRDVVMLTIGTGLGGAYYSKGDLLRGSFYQGGEFGHVIFLPGGRQCSCGQEGCVEQYVSGRALSLNYKELTGQDLLGEAIRERTKTDVNAQRAFSQLGRNLGTFLISLKNIFDPEVFVIGGGVVTSRAWFWTEMVKTFKTGVNHLTEVEILPAENLSGLLGASKMAEVNHIGR